MTTSFSKIDLTCIARPACEYINCSKHCWQYILEQISFFVATSRRAWNYTGVFPVLDFSQTLLAVNPRADFVFYNHEPPSLELHWRFPSCGTIVRRCHIQSVSTTTSTNRLDVRCCSHRKMEWNKEVVSTLWCHSSADMSEDTSKSNVWPAMYKNAWKKSSVQVYDKLT